jgi:hypothetical protein
MFAVILRKDRGPCKEIEGNSCGAKGIMGTAAAVGTLFGLFGIPLIGEEKKRRGKEELWSAASDALIRHGEPFRWFG